MVKCLFCGSEDISFSSSKNGFSGGKALAGAVLAGPIGLLAGAIGKNNPTTVCLCNTCHRSFSFKDFEKGENKRKQLEKFNNSSKTVKFLRNLQGVLLSSAIIAVPISWTSLTYGQAYLTSLAAVLVIYGFASKYEHSK